MKCPEHIQNEGTSGESIRIFSDSQAAIKAVDNQLCKSWTEAECKEAWNRVGHCNSITILWIPGNSGLRGIPRIISVGLFFNIQVIRGWTSLLWETYWDEIPGHRLSKLLINKDSCKYLTNLNRKPLRLITGYLTGHFINRSYLFRIGKCPSPLCRLCNLEDETSEHILLSCSALDLVRYRCLRNPTPTHEFIRS